MTRYVVITTLVVAAGLQLACSGSSSEAPAPSAAMSLEKLAEWGCEDCAGEALLTTVAVSLTPEGNVATVDRYEPLIRIFDRLGASLSAFGRLGEGPGEMGLGIPGESVPPLAVYPFRGELLVYDAMPARLQRFDTEGNYRGTIALPQGFPRQFDYAPAQERLYVLSLVPGSSTPTILRFDRWDDSPAPAVTVEGDVAAFFAGLEDDKARRDYAFAATPDGGFVLADSWNYRIRRFDEKGTLVGESGRQLDRPLKSPEELARDREEAMEEATALGVPAEEPDPGKPHFGSFALNYDSAGRLWVHTTRGSDGDAIFDVFDASGGFVGEVHAAALLKSDVLRYFDVSDGYLAAIVLDESENTKLETWRVILRNP